ncbi:hypothetical protein J4430_00640 [Candidatus Woesearchaeota archaeon]|nr:hypothetical protein [Candidatus Woesearchaeota archaeon]
MNDFSQQPTLKMPPEVEEKLKKLKEQLDKFKKEVLKKCGEVIIGVELLPPEPLPVEEEKKLSDAEKKERREQLPVLVLLNDGDTGKLNKYEFKEKYARIIEEIAPKIDKNIKLNLIILSELKEYCFDAKYEILHLIGTGSILYDKGILGALKAAEIHKEMAIKKFDRYIVSYVAAGSLFRGDANPHDIDIYVVVDDTDVKKMPRVELKDKLRAIIQGMGFDAGRLAGVQASFHVQTYILTDFWDNIKDANPVIFTFLRDGVPLYDRGTFMPWKLLLQMGRIKPSPEAIDMNMDIGERLVDRTRHKLLSVVGEDLYYAALNPAQAAIMLYGIPPPTPKETVKLLDDIFVKKERLLEKRYVDILMRLIQYFKDVEHGKIKNISGKEIDNLLKDVEDYLKRIKKLFNQIEKKSYGRSVLETYDRCIRIVRDAIYVTTQKEPNLNKIEKDFKSILVDEGKVPEQYLRTFRLILKAKRDYDTKKISKQEIDKVHKEARVFIKGMVEYIQRRKGLDIERAKIRFKYGNNFGEIMLLDNVAFITGNLQKREDIKKADIVEGGLHNVVKSSLDELEKHLTQTKIPDKVFIQERIFEDLKRLYGEKVEILLGY